MELDKPTIACSPGDTMNNAGWDLIAPGGMPGAERIRDSVIHPRREALAAMRPLAMTADAGGPRRAQGLPRGRRRRDEPFRPTARSAARSTKRSPTRRAGRLGREHHHEQGSRNGAGMVALLRRAIFGPRRWKSRGPWSRSPATLPPGGPSVAPRGGGDPARRPLPGHELSDGVERQSATAPPPRRRTGAGRTTRRVPSLAGRRPREGRRGRHSRDRLEVRVVVVVRRP